MAPTAAEAVWHDVVSSSSSSEWVNSSDEEEVKEEEESDEEDSGEEIPSVKEKPKKFKNETKIFINV